MWLALDEDLNRHLAIYWVDANSLTARAVLAAARTSATVPDTRFVQVLDAGEDERSAFVVTEWVPRAHDLTSLLSQGPLPPVEATRFLAGLCQAMACAHERRVPHLRLDPHNLLRTGSDQVKIRGLFLDATCTGLADLDFPEAVVTDLRAAGALAFAAYTARWPQGPAYGLAEAPLGTDGAPLPPSQVCPGVPEAVDEVVMTLLNAAEGSEPGSFSRAAEAFDALEARLQALDDEESDLGPLPSDAGATVTPNGPDPGVTAPHELPPTGELPRVRTALRAWSRSRPVVLSLIAAVAAASLALILAQFPRKAASPPTPSTTSTTHPTTVSTTPLKIAGASLWQASSHDEHATDVGNTLTGKSGGWSTNSYKDGPKMLIKPGTGIIYDLGAAHTIERAEVRIGASGARLALLAADPGLDALPPVQASAPPGFHEVATRDAQGTDVTLTPDHPVTTRYLLVWFTALPAQGTTAIHPFPYYDSIVQVRFFA